MKRTLRAWMELMMSLLSRSGFEAFIHGLDAWLVEFGLLDTSDFKDSNHLQ